MQDKRTNFLKRGKYTLTAICVPFWRSIVTTKAFVPPTPLATLPFKALSETQNVASQELPPPLKFVLTPQGPNPAPETERVPPPFPTRGKFPTPNAASICVLYENTSKGEFPS